MDVAHWDLVLGINLRGTMLMSKHVLGGMLARKQGNIIHLSSIEGVVAADYLGAYNASKSAVIGLTRNMAIDYGPHQIRVNCICPGYIATPMTEAFSQDALKNARKRLERQATLGRMGHPSEIASVALFLASEDASYVTGHALVADGGFTAGHRIFEMDA
jgi:NAD(P)-dependent dehydrogenase (short-subunit alcohol dehydrogenase family)